MENVLNFLNLDKIIILPSSNPPHKVNKQKTEADLRIEMVKRAIKDNPRVELSTYEARNNDIVYTHETLDYFKKTYPYDEFYYIMGEDSFMSIDTWKNYNKILNDKLIVFTRSNTNADSELVKKVNEIRKDNEQIFLINNLNINISSTLIRKLVKEGKSIKYLVKDEVLDFIKEHNLYVWFRKLGRQINCRNRS